MFTDLTLKDFIKKTSSSDPTPGGGAVSAISATLGIALILMAFRITFKKTEKPNILLDFENRGEALIDKLSNLADEDSKVYDFVMKAYKMSKETEEEKLLRSEKIQESLKIASDIPMEIAKTCHEAIELSKIFEQHCKKSCFSDFEAGNYMLKTAIKSVLLNVKINITMIKDVEYVEKLKAEMEKLL